MKERSVTQSYKSTDPSVIIQMRDTPELGWIHFQKKWLFQSDVRISAISKSLKPRQAWVSSAFVLFHCKTFIKLNQPTNVSSPSFFLVFTQTSTSPKSHLWRWRSRWVSLGSCARRPPSWPCGWQRRLHARPPARCHSLWCPPEWSSPLCALGGGYRETRSMACFPRNSFKSMR